ncbi:MAG: DUF4112 domain-containing protein [Sphingobacterium sp.]|uniref:DUF4112 domain-containing protein n=1 Tax=Sphingobacterium sp. JB170 TaxID=1434842 RepID=UPI00097F160C|nr:DUF4112 domain-containing protein [Sphingobacterium sp. JB170]SJN21305.1 Bll7046 protein [Sphingobacterium sp. JB170]
MDSHRPPKIPGQTDLQRDRDFRWVERFATLLDNQFSIGSFRFGLDPLLNFIPLAGQAISLGSALLLVLVMYRNGVSPNAASKMLINVLWDAFLGSIPFLGNVFDFFKKANAKNIKILKEYYYQGKHQGGAKRLFVGLFILILLTTFLLIYLLWLLGAWIVTLF